MKICIIGAGVVGSYLAKNLSQEGYDVAIIDRDREKIEDIQNSIDVAAFTCDAFDEECIGEFKDFDFFIVVTNKDEVNLSVALILKAVLKKEKVLIRVDKDILSKKEIEHFLGVEIVNTFGEIYRNVETLIDYPFMKYFNELEEGKFVLFGYKIKEDRLKNVKISELKTIRSIIPFTIVLIERDGKSLIPKGDRVLLENDTVYILIEKTHLNSFIKEFKIPYLKINSVVFLGSSKLGDSLLKRLSHEKKLNIKVIEPDIEKCEQIAEENPEVMVIHGKYTDEELLKKEEISEADLVISASYGEDGILACILAKRLGAKKVLALIEKPEYEEIAVSLGIDIPIVARKLVARKVYRKIKHKGFVDVFELKKDLNVYEKFVDKKLEGKKVSEISTKNFIILGMKRDDTMYIVSGDTVLHEGDTLIVLEGISDE